MRGHVVIHPDPTPAEIAERCQAIRETWTAGQRRLRAGAIPTAPRGWTPPVVRLPAEVAQAIGERGGDF